MKRKIFLTVFFIGVAFACFSQTTPFIGAKDNRMETLNNSQNSDISLKVVTEQEVEIFRKVEGSHTGFKFVPLMPFFPRKAPGVIHFESSELMAENNALKGTDGDFILNKRVERTFTGILLIVWIEKVTVSGYAARLKK